MGEVAVPPLSAGTKVSYGIGQVAEGLKNTAMATFVLFYYNQVLGLSGTLAGLALGIALVFDALTDPVAGSISDNLRSRMGRRHPFIYASALPLGVAFFLMFYPPSSLLGEWGLFAWMTVTVVLTRAAMTLFHVPHIALGAELSDDYEERTTVVSYRYFCSTFGSLLVFVLGFGWFFADARGGQVAPQNYAPFALTLAVIMVASVLWTGWGTRHRIPYLRSPEPGPDLPVRQVIARVFQDLGGALRNRSFRWLFGGVLILFVMVGVDSALNLYMFNYFWELPSSLTLWLFLALPLGALVGAPLTRVLHRYINKHTTVLLGTAWFAVLELMPVLLRLAGWFPDNGDPAVFWILLVVRFLIGGRRHPVHGELQLDDGGHRRPARAGDRPPPGRHLLRRHIVLREGHLGTRQSGGWYRPGRHRLAARRRRPLRRRRGARDHRSSRHPLRAPGRRLRGGGGLVPVALRPDPGTPRRDPAGAGGAAAGPGGTGRGGGRRVRAGRLRSFRASGG